MARFRFQDLQIWQLGIEITDDLLDIADVLEEKRRYKFAEQLRGAVMSITNNISEGSGSFSNRDFANFLNMSRRSVFEVVNIEVSCQASNNGQSGVSFAESLRYKKPYVAMAMRVFCALTFHKIYSRLTRHLRLDTTLVVLHRRKFIDKDLLDRQMDELDELSRKITNFRKSLGT